MGWADPLPSGRWIGRYRNAEGKRRSAGTYAREKDAKRAADEAEAKTRGFGEYTWSQWWDEWEPLHLEQGRSPGTVEAYKRSEEKRIRPRWGDTKLMDIEPGAIELWARSLRRDYAQSTVRVTIGAMGVALRDAWLAKKVDRIATRGVPILGGDEDEDTEVRFFSDNEATAIRAELGVDDKQIFDFLLMTGARISEACGICWEDIDFAARIVNVRRGWSRQDLQYVPTKNRTVRKVPMPRKLETILRLRLAVVGDSGPVDFPALKVPKPVTGPVFMSGARPLNALSFLRRLQTAARTAKVSGVTNHALRHTFAARLLLGGASMYMVQKMLGHKTIKTTEKYYAHLLDESHDVVRAILDGSV